CAPRDRPSLNLISFHSFTGPPGNALVAATAPTLAWPPSLTVTCSTTTRCWLDLPLSFASASRCSAKSRLIHIVRSTLRRSPSVSDRRGSRAPETSSPYRAHPSSAVWAPQRRTSDRSPGGLPCFSHPRRLGSMAD